MPATKVQLIGGPFEDAEGNVLALGYLEMKLSQDETVSGVGQIAAGITIRIELGVTGNVATSPVQAVWGNDQMLPVNSYYRVKGFTSSGQLAWGPNNQQVTGSGGTFDVGTWVPNTVISWIPALQALGLEVNGTVAPNQSTLNFEDTASVTWSIDSSGNLEATAATAAALDLKTNGVDNGDQTLFNLEDTATVEWTDDGVGGVTANVPSSAFGSGGQFFWGGVGDFALPTEGTSTRPAPGVDNAIAAVLFKLNSRVVVRSVVIKSGNTVPGMKAGFGIADTGKNILLQALFTSTTSVEMLETVITPVTLEPGAYYFVWTGNNANFTVFALNLVGTINAMLNFPAGVDPKVATCSNTSTGGVLPATLGTLTAYTLNLTNSIPAVLFSA